MLGDNKDLYEKLVNKLGKQSEQLGGVEALNGSMG